MTHLPPYENSGFLACFPSSLLSWFWFGIAMSKFFLNEPLSSQPVLKVMTMIASVLLVQLVCLHCDPLSEFSNVDVAELLRHFLCACFSSHNFLEKEVVSTSLVSLGVSVWIATCASYSSAMDSAQSMAAGVVPQPSCRLSPTAYFSDHSSLLW
jgi:hypothetical protein